MLLHSVLMVLPSPAPADMESSGRGPCVELGLSWLNLPEGGDESSPGFGREDT
jgi:hypothetical protein